MITFAQLSTGRLVNLAHIVYLGDEVILSAPEKTTRVVTADGGETLTYMDPPHFSEDELNELWLLIAGENTGPCLVRLP